WLPAASMFVGLSVAFSERHHPLAGKRSNSEGAIQFRVGTGEALQFFRRADFARRSLTRRCPDARFGLAAAGFGLAAAGFGLAAADFGISAWSRRRLARSSAAALDDRPDKLFPGPANFGLGDPFERDFASGA